MTQFTDVELNTDNGYYDISFENGDFKKIEGFDTAIWISIFTDARASESQVEEPHRRRGWIGNENNPVELGSLNWLYEQARLINATVNGIVDSTQRALQWLIDFNYATRVEVVPIRGNTQLEADITIFRSDNVVETSRLELWNNTPNPTT